jgi:predicted DNA-binding transcriptional regulator AlpA
MPDPTTDLLWAAKTVAERLDVSQTTLWRHRRRGDFPKPIIINSRLFWRVADIVRWAHGLPAASPEEEEALRARLPGWKESPNA